MEYLLTLTKFSIIPITIPIIIMMITAENTILVISVGSDEIIGICPPENSEIGKIAGWLRSNKKTAMYEML